MKDGQGSCKVKGFTLHYKNMKKINKESLLKLIEGAAENNEELITTTDTRFITTSAHKVYTRQVTKSMKFEYDKRRIDWINKRTIPW